MKIDFYNPIKDIVSVDGKEMKTDEFKQMCFNNGWEGTLLRICELEHNVMQRFEKLFNKDKESEE